MKNLILKNDKISVEIAASNGALISVTDIITGEIYGVSADGFSAVIDGERYFENTMAESYSKTSAGAEFLYADGGVSAKLEYVLSDGCAFIEKKLSLERDGEWTVDSVTSEDITFAVPAKEIIYHDDQTLWHVPTNYFVRYEKGGIYLGLEYPYWDTETDGESGISIGFSPRYTVKDGEWFECETVFLGVYRIEGITRHSHGPYPNGKPSKYHEIFKGCGLDQHFKDNTTPEDAGLPEEVLDWGEVWAMQEFFECHLPIQPLPEEGFWIWQNGWWAGLFSPDVNCLEPLRRAGVHDVLTAAMYYGHDSHPCTEPNYIRDARIDPIGFPIYEHPDEEGVKDGMGGWHRVVYPENKEEGIIGYTDTFEAPAAYDKFIQTALDMGIYVTSFSTPNNAYKNRPEWWARTENGKAHEYFRNRLSCPACDEFMDFHFEVLCKVMDRYPGRYWSLDGRWLNYRELAGYHFKSIGEAKCYSTEHGHPVGDSKYKEWKNIQKFKKKLRERYPDKCFEQYYGLKRGGAWALTHLNADENYYEMGSPVNNRYQTWHNENSRFRPMYLNYSSIFGTDPKSFDYSIISTFSTAYYAQLSNGYKALEKFPQCADMLKKRKKWADENHRFFKKRRTLFGEPGEYAVDGSAHITDDEGLIFIFSADGNFADVRIPFNRWIGLSENKDAEYFVAVEDIVHRKGGEASCEICSHIVRYGEKLRCRVSPDSALILRVRGKKDSDDPSVKEVCFTPEDEVAEAF